MRFPFDFPVYFGYPQILWITLLTNCGQASSGSLSGVKRLDWSKFRHPRLIYEVQGLAFGGGISVAVASDFPATPSQV